MLPLHITLFWESRGITEFIDPVKSCQKQSFRAVQNDDFDFPESTIFGILLNRGMQCTIFSSVSDSSDQDWTALNVNLILSLYRSVEYFERSCPVSAIQISFLSCLTIFSPALLALPVS